MSELIQHLSQHLPPNQIIVDADVAHHARVALDRMLALPA